MKPSSTDAPARASAVQPFELPPLVPVPRGPVPTPATPAAPAAPAPAPAPAAPAAPAAPTQASFPAPASGPVRVARFDRQLSGSGGAGVAVGWGDPVVDKLVAEAVEHARAEGLAQGYAAGWAQGRRAAAEREAVERAERDQQAAADRRATAERAASLLAGLAEATHGATRDGEQAWSQVADALTDGALAVARAVLARELAAVDAPVAEAVRTAVRLLGDADAAGPLAVRVHPDDAAVLAELPGATPADAVRLVPDTSVRPGTVLATTPAQRLLVDLPGAVAAARQVLDA